MHCFGSCLGVVQVQSNHFLDFLAPKLQEVGYSAIYKKKTTEIYANNAYAIDGCATFFRRDRFALVKKYEVRPAFFSFVFSSSPVHVLPCHLLLS